MIRGTLEHASVTQRPKGTLQDLVGLLKSDGPPPTDEEVAEMLHEENMRRYGP